MQVEDFPPDDLLENLINDKILVLKEEHCKPSSKGFRTLLEKSISDLERKLVQVQAAKLKHNDATERGNDLCALLLLLTNNVVELQQYIYNATSPEILGLRGHGPVSFDGVCVLTRSRIMAASKLINVLKALWAPPKEA